MDSLASVQNNVDVVIRVRPVLPKELENNDVDRALTIDNQELTINRSYGFKSSKKFSFDSILQESTNQKQVFERMQRAVDYTLSGYNACVLCYGQSGSGKTYTLLNDEGLHTKHEGIIPRAMKHIFQEKRKDLDRKTLVTVSYVQIYCEMLQDLFVPENSKLVIREDPDYGIFVAGLSRHEVNSVDDVVNLISMGHENRVTAFTHLNATSSRSHAVLIVNIDKFEHVDRDQLNDPNYVSGNRGVVSSRLMLCDLAGSERIKVSGATSGVRKQEAAAINQSLSVLGSVVNILSQGRSDAFVPYRDSKLTRLLKDCLGGNSRTVMICTLSPLLKHSSESYSTLLFAQRACKVQTRARKNVFVDYKALAQKLQLELDQTAEKLARLTVELSNREQNNERIKQLEHQLAVAEESTGKNEVLEAQFKQKEEELMERIFDIEGKNDWLVDKYASQNAKVDELEREKLENEVEIKTLEDRQAQLIAANAEMEADYELKKRGMDERQGELTNELESLQNLIAQTSKNVEEARILHEEELQSKTRAIEAEYEEEITEIMDSNRKLMEETETRFVGQISHITQQSDEALAQRDEIIRSLQAEMSEMKARYKQEMKEKDAASAEALQEVRRSVVESYEKEKQLLMDNGDDRMQKLTSHYETVIDENRRMFSEQLEDIEDEHRMEMEELNEDAQKLHTMLCSETGKNEKFQRLLNASVCVLSDFRIKIGKVLLNESSFTHNIDRGNRRVEHILDQIYRCDEPKPVSMDFIREVAEDVITVAISNAFIEIDNKKSVGYATSESLAISYSVLHKSLTSHKSMGVLEHVPISNISGIPSLRPPLQKFIPEAFLSSEQECRSNIVRFPIPHVDSLDTSDIARMIDTEFNDLMNVSSELFEFSDSEGQSEFDFPIIGQKFEDVERYFSGMLPFEMLHADERHHPFNHFVLLSNELVTRMTAHMFNVRSMNERTMMLERTIMMLHERVLDYEKQLAEKKRLEIENRRLKLSVVSFGAEIQRYRMLYDIARDTYDEGMTIQKKQRKSLAVLAERETRIQNKMDAFNKTTGIVFLKQLLKEYKEGVGIMVDFFTNPDSLYFKQFMRERKLGKKVKGGMFHSPAPIKRTLKDETFNPLRKLELKKRKRRLSSMSQMSSKSE
ncbi:hypothetical protein PCE1_002006 [Barthelona sp. PCE]